MENKQETIFINGMRFYKPKENSPEWIKGNLVIEKTELVEFLKTCPTETVRIDLKKSKEGKLYLALNTFNPIKKEEPKRESPKSIDSIPYPSEEYEEEPPF